MERSMGQGVSEKWLRKKLKANLLRRPNSHSQIQTWLPQNHINQLWNYFTTIAYSLSLSARTRTHRSLRSEQNAPYRLGDSVGIDNGREAYGSSWIRTEGVLNSDIFFILGYHQGVGRSTRFLHQLDQAMRRIDSYTILQRNRIVWMVDLATWNIFVYYQTNELVVVSEIILEVQENIWLVCSMMLNKWPRDLWLKS